jgi:hypothetical protein
MKNYVAIVRDHSRSMLSVAAAAKVDYNSTVRQIRDSAIASNLDTIVSVVQCGIGPGEGKVAVETNNSSVLALSPMSGEYVTNGNSTPLFDSVAKAIELLSGAPDAGFLDVSFLVLVTTDGEENASKKWTARTLSKHIKELQSTDRWTFAFRVPAANVESLVKMGIPRCNICAWEQTVKGLETAEAAQVSAVETYYTARRFGQKAVKSFYVTDLTAVSPLAMAALMNITGEVVFYTVDDASLPIKEFIEKKSGRYHPGTVFYELNKTEKIVQGNKAIALREKSTGSVFSGAAVRVALGLPDIVNVSLRPGDHGKWQVYIQSTSLNRKLILGSQVMVWNKVRLG